MKIPKFHEVFRKFIKIMNIPKYYEMSRKFMKIMKFIEILDFCESGGSKTLIFLRNYLCFCNVMNSMGFFFFTENLKFHDFPFSLHCPRISMKTHFFSKIEPMAPRTPQNVQYFIGLNNIRGSRPRGCENMIFLQKVKNLFRAFHEK